jgi:hypothetical protein
MRIIHFKEYLQKDMEDNEGFYEVVGTFVAKVSSLSDTHRREKNIQSPTEMKKIKACWLKRIHSLKEMMNELDVVKSKRGDLFLKLVDFTKEINIPNLLMDTIILSK